MLPIIHFLRFMLAETMTTRVVLFKICINASAVSHCYEAEALSGIL